MSDPSAAFDPYQPPTDKLPTIPDTKLAPGQRPGILTAICVIAILLGILGLLTALLGFVGLLLTGFIQSAMGTPGPNAPQEVIDARRMQQQQMAVMQFFSPYLIASYLFHLVVTILLFAGGLRTMAMSHRGRTLLVAGCWAAIFFVLGRFTLNVLIQMQNIPIMDEMMRNAMESGNQKMPESMASIIKYSMIGGMVIQAAWEGLKLFFYGYSIRYLGKPDVIDIFDEAEALQGRPPVSGMGAPYGDPAGIGGAPDSPADPSFGQDGPPGAPPGMPPGAPGDDSGQQPPLSEGR